jgi:myo-inositol-1(or 4)-monophosphatase
VCGVIYDPIHQEMFTAEQGGGAYLNNRRMRVARTSRLADALGSTGFPSRKRSHNVNIHFYYQLAMASHGVRRTGSAALDLAYVAAGRLDLFWEFGLKPWDQAAGVLLVREAGGTVADMCGQPISITASEHLLADNGLLHEEILAMFRLIFSGHPPLALPELG